MDIEKVISFDQSTTCTGYTLATLDRASSSILFLKTYSIKPKNPPPTELGYLTKEAAFINSKGKPYKALLTFTDEKVSYTESKRRKRLYRDYCEKSRYNNTVSAVEKLIIEFSPDIVLFEENMAFRSMDVTRKLAEIASAIKAVCLIKNIPVVPINVHTARKKWELQKQFRSFMTLHQGKKITDLTKETLRWLIADKYKDYGVTEEINLDESDSIVIFDEWYTSLRRR